VVEPGQTQLPPTWFAEAQTADFSETTVSQPPLVRFKRLRAIVKASLVVGLASMTATAIATGIRQAGWLEPSEVAVFDRMVQMTANPRPDPRLLVVGITEADIHAQKRFPLSDRTVAEVLKRLLAYQPRAIGLDLLRDIPQEPGQELLRNELKAPNVITITNLGATESFATPPPLGVPPERVGFNDLVMDNDGVVRRNLMMADLKSTTYYSFSLRLAMTYLAAQRVVPKPFPNDPKIMQLGKGVFYPLEQHSGGYQTIDAQGYQVLLHYRGKHVAHQISLGEVLNGQMKPEWVKDKIVLIGTTALTGKDLFFTPYSPTESQTPRMAGVLIHAQLISQLLNAALNNRSLFWFWPEPLEILWIGGWAVVAGSLVWCVRHPLWLGLGAIAILTTVTAACFFLFIQQGWVPLIAPVLVIGTTGAIVLIYQASMIKQRTSY
jgi:CHASE2 domain-containing sensor protein